MNVKLALEHLSEALKFLSFHRDIIKKEKYYTLPPSNQFDAEIAHFLLRKSGFIYMYVNIFEQLFATLTEFLLGYENVIFPQIGTNQTLIDTLHRLKYLADQERVTVANIISSRNRLVHSSVLYLQVSAPDLVAMSIELEQITYALIPRMHAKLISCAPNK